MASSSMDENFVQYIFSFLSSETSVAEKVSFFDNAWLIPNVGIEDIITLKTLLPIISGTFGIFLPKLYN